MTDDNEGFAQWRDNVESRVSTLEATFATETRRRARMASDVNDLKLGLAAQKGLLQALAKTQSDHTATLANHTATLADHTARLTRLEAGMTEVRAGIHTIIDLLEQDTRD